MISKAGLNLEVFITVRAPTSGLCPVTHLPPLPSFSLFLYNKEIYIDYR